MQGYAEMLVTKEPEIITDEERAVLRVLATASLQESIFDRVNLGRFSRQVLNSLSSPQNALQAFREYVAYLEDRFGTFDKKFVGIFNNNTTDVHELRQICRAILRHRLYSFEAMRNLDSASEVDAMCATLHRAATTITLTQGPLRVADLKNLDLNGSMLESSATLGNKGLNAGSPAPIA